MIHIITEIVEYNEFIGQLIQPYKHRRNPVHHTSMWTAVKKPEDLFPFSTACFLDSGRIMASIPTRL